MKTRKKIYEGISEVGTPDLRYYAFDWDDNIMRMPTTIFVLDENGNEVEMSTEDFAEYRTEIGKNPFNYKGKQIVGLEPKTAFRNFRTDGDEQFKMDVFTAQLGPAWDDFLEAVNNGSIFSIITARGHDPKTLREAVYNLIVTNHAGINRDELLKNLKKYRKFMGMEKMSDRELIEYYLDMCRFYPVSFGTGSEANPEEEKVKAMREFVSYVKQLSDELKQRARIKNMVMNNFVPMIGFSDDDIRNVEVMNKFFEDEPDNIVRTYHTKDGRKTRKL